MASLRYTIIEETGVFQSDSSHEDFVSHFYETRYSRLKGILMATPEQLHAAIKKVVYDFIGKNQYELALLRDEEKDGMGWSMSWYRLRTPEKKTYKLSDEDKEKIISDFVELRKTSPLTGEIFIIQRDGSDMLLVAVSLILEQ
jgi:hypothetical protein